MSEAAETTPQKTSPYTRLVEKAFAEAIPLSAQFELTFRCNHLCSFCYNAPDGSREMTTPEIFDTLKKIADFGVLYLTLTGGEALCHKDFWKIAEESRRLGMALRLYTNGYLFADAALVRRLKGLNPMEIEISIHGATPETHDALTRIKGSFQKTVQAVRNLKAEGLRVQLKTPITRLNQGELFETKRLAEELGCPIAFDAVITPKDDGSLDPLSLRPDDEFLQKYWGEWYLQLHDGKLPPRGNHCATERAEANCGTGRSGFTIDPYGNILPCVAFRRPVANIKSVASLNEVWGSSPVLNEVRDLAVEARSKLNERADGRYIQFCLGVAEKQVGDPLAVYPQAEINAGAVRRSYELLQIGKAER